MDITLPKDLESFAQAESARRGFKNPGGFMQSLLETEKHRHIRSEVESLLLETVGGPFSEWTEQDMNDIRRDGTRMIKQLISR